MNTFTSTKRARGFSLIEVMVSLVVICVGLLGVAKMQALSLASTNISRQRSIAAIEAASLGAAMRANRLYWSGRPFGYVLTWTPAGAPPFSVVPADATLTTAANAGNVHACDGVAAGPAACPNATSNTALAATDLASWTASLAAVLPNPVATISCGAPVGSSLPPSCTINITWSETSVAMTSVEAAQEATTKANGTQGQFEKPTYTLYVEP